MANSFTFELVSPERLLISEQVESVVIPGTEGEMTVMAGHAPVMATIKPGIIIAKTATGTEHRYVVFGGFADVRPSVCTVLAEAGMAHGDVRKEDFERHIETAKSEISNARDDHHRTKLEEMLNHLATLRDAV